MSCDICIGGDDYDFCVGFEGYFPTDHDEKCLECRSVIRAGETAQKVHWNPEDEDEEDYAPEYLWTCAACADIRAVYSCGEVQPVGGMWEILTEGFDDLKMAGECWDSLSAEGKEKLLAEWRKWKGL